MAPLPVPMGVSTGESPPLEALWGRLMECTSSTLVFLAQNQWFWKARKVFSRSWPRVSAGGSCEFSPHARSKHKTGKRGLRSNMLQIDRAEVVHELHLMHIWEEQALHDDACSMQGTNEGLGCCCR